MQRVNVVGDSPEAMVDLMRADGVQVVRQTLRRLGGSRFRVQVYGDETAIESLGRSGYEVEHVEDVPMAAPPPRGARPAPAGRAPEGYLSVADVERRMAELAATYPDMTRLIELPHRTWEGRTCHGLRIGRGDDRTPAVLLLGGVHAREWGSPDILIAFAERLLTAWLKEKGIAIGNRRFRASSIRRLVSESVIYIVPQVNPDGRHHSFTAEPMWRKNRRPAPAGGGDDCVGVDINRNFDFLWDFATAFSPDAPVACSSNPCDAQVYVGPTACSEPETKNVVWLLDQHPEISYLIDLHSYGELIMYSWGDDQNQDTDRHMSFGNSDWDGKRGVFDDQYREFLADGDRTLLLRLGEAMRAGVAASRGRQYRVQQSANLYPTAGTSDDYAYSRHLANPELGKVLAFTVEWGSEDNPTPFHPPYAEMKKIIAEVTSGLLAFCGEAARINAANSLRKVA